MMPKDGLSDTEMDTPQEIVPKDSLSDTETPLATKNGAKRWHF